MDICPVAGTLLCPPLYRQSPKQKDDMKKLTMLFLVIVIAGNAVAQNKFSKHEISINGFRNPSVGAEYRHRRISMHAGYYPTNFESGITTEFIKTGLTYWFLPVGKKQNP